MDSPTLAESATAPAVRFELAEPDIALVTIDRPEARNAINAAVRGGLFNAFARIERDPAIRVAILTGAGDRAFCAGADLKEMAEMALAVPPPGFFPVLGENVQMTKPVIAAVNGDAFAGGWMFAQMCDLCIASEKARFGITEAKVGRGFPWATPLIAMIPQRVIAEILMTGEPISAARAAEIGFVNRVVAADELLSAALAMARRIADNAPLTVAAAKEMVRLSTEMGRSAARRAADELFEPVYRSADAQEGPAAFRERRPPRWRGV